jgi:membrane protease YdiL (CAAX protease family)
VSDAPTPRCARCGAALRHGARFCASCGVATRAGERDRRRSFAAWRGEGRDAAVAVAWCFAGVLGSILLSSALSGDLTPLAASIAAYLLAVVAGAAAVARLGSAAVPETLPLRCRPVWLPAGVAAGGISFGVGWLYARALLRAFGVEPGGPEPQPPLVEEVVATVVLPALVEEWLYRGVLWAALSRMTSARGTLLASAALFGLVHGFEAWIFSVPHRFAGGLLFGWLRARSGSLVPPVLGHATNNLVAVLA